jgi:hypothetical protein
MWHVNAILALAATIPTLTQAVFINPQDAGIAIKTYHYRTATNGIQDQSKRPRKRWQAT